MITAELFEWNDNEDEDIHLETLNIHKTEVPEFIIKADRQPVQLFQLITNSNESATYHLVDLDSIHVIS